jgi:hypothetical protein
MDFQLTYGRPERSLNFDHISRTPQVKACGSQGLAGVKATLMASLATPLTCMVTGPAERSNRTLFLAPLQPVTPLNLLA